MSYDLIFWKQQPNAGLDPEAVYTALNDEQDVVGLQVLPVDEWLQAVITEFPGAIREPNGSREWVDWVCPDDSSSFQIEWSRVHVNIACRNLDEEQMNRLIDIAARYGCPLYDPQAEERFDSWCDT